jgi:RNA polymerase sigma-B factor
MTATTTTLHQDLPRDVRKARTSELFERASVATGAERDGLIEEVVLVNTGVARTIARRYAHRGLALEDLEQVAYLALVRAAQKFDGALGEDFLVFAVPTIRGEIKRWFRDRGWAVRPSRKVQELQTAVLRVREEATERGGAPDSAEIARQLGVEESDVEEALAVNGCFSPMSLDAPVDSSGDGTSLGELLPCQDDGMSGADTRVLLEQALAKLTEREQLIVRLRYFEDLTQGEIGERIGVTQMQVSRLLSRIFRDIREEMGSVRDADLSH